jgi:hypothetical protein
VSAPVANDFALSASPSSVTATQGAAAGPSTISSTLTSGASQTVSLSASGLPTGASATFAPSTIASAGGSSTVTIATSSSTPTGSYPITVTGTGAVATHTTSVTLTVVSSGAPGLVQSAAGTASATATAITSTFHAPTTSGHLLVVAASVYTGATNHITSITDSAGNTWTRIGAYFASGHFSDGELWYSANAAATTTVTIHVATAASMAFEALEFSGIAAANPVDVSTGTSNIGTTPDSGTVTPGSSELVVGFLAGHGNAQALTVTTAGYTSQAQATTTGTAVTVRTAYQVVNSANPIGIAGSFSTSMYWTAGIAAFKRG